MKLHPWFEQAAIITGGADGLGYALATRLCGLGVSVALFDVDDKKLNMAKSSLGDEVEAFHVDVSDAIQVKEAVDRYLHKRGRIDILVNAAGITGKTNIKSHEVELADFDRVVRINLRGSFVVFQAVVPHMLDRNYGRVLHMASIAGKEGNAGMVAYSASKAGVIGMTKSQGKEYAETGITINALAPAVIKTSMHDKMPIEQIRYMTEKIPMKRCGTLQEFAATASWIVSSENSFTTGFTFDLSGGRAVY